MVTWQVQAEDPMASQRDEQTLGCCQSPETQLKLAFKQGEREGRREGERKGGTLLIGNAVCERGRRLGRWHPGWLLAPCWLHCLLAHSCVYWQLQRKKTGKENLCSSPRRPRKGPWQVAWSCPGIEQLPKSAGCRPHSRTKPLEVCLGLFATCPSRAPGSQNSLRRDERAPA